jgi:mRNA interferase MazF
MTIPVDRPLQPGALILVDLEPVRGSEQRGTRPAVVVSTIEMNTLTRRIVICPSTRNLDPWPSKVFLPDGLGADGSVLVDQVRSVDRNARVLRFIGTVPEHVLAEVRAKLAALIGVEIGSGSEESKA